jgi:MinD superfamily P-loop ATPase
MKVIACISGRSSKGKDTLLSAIAELSFPSVIVDCSFEYNIIRSIYSEKSKTLRKLPFFRGFSFDKERCSHCRQCLEICHQDAIDYVDGQIKYYEYRCSHCGSCIRWCPLMVMNLKEQSDISLIISQTRVGPVIYTESLLEPSLMRDMIRYLRDQAFLTARSKKIETILINGSKGSNDTSILALTGVDAVIIVVSPSIWAFEDLDHDVRLSRLSGVEPHVILNMSGLDPDFDEQFVIYCSEKQLHLTGRIPADKDFRQAILGGKTILEHSPDSVASEAIRIIWTNVNEQITRFRS